MESKNNFKDFDLINDSLNANYNPFNIKDNEMNINEYNIENADEFINFNKKNEGGSNSRKGVKNQRPLGSLGKPENNKKNDTGKTQGINQAANQVTYQDNQNNLQINQRMEEEYQGTQGNNYNPVNENEDSFINDLTKFRKFALNEIESTE